MGRIILELSFLGIFNLICLFSVELNVDKCYFDVVYHDGVTNLCLPFFIEMNLSTCNFM